METDLNSAGAPLRARDSAADSAAARPLSEFGVALRRARDARGLSQRALAGGLKLHQPQVAKAERGDDMLASRLLEFAEFLEHEVVLVPKSRAAEVRAVLARAERRAPAAAQTIVTGAGRSPAAADSDSTEPARDLREAPHDHVEHTLRDYAREWPSVDPQVFGIMSRIRRASEYLWNTLEALAGLHGMNSGEILVLGALRRLGPPYESTASNLRREFWITLPGIAKRIEHLATLGFLERVPNAQDRRASTVRLTATGKAVLDDYVYRAAAPEYTALLALSKTDRHTLSRLLARVLESFERRPLAGRSSSLRTRSR